MRQAPVSPHLQAPAKAKKRKSKSRPAGKRAPSAVVEAIDATDVAKPAPIEGSLQELAVVSASSQARAAALLPTQDDIDCPTCSRRLPGWAKFCRACGASQAATRSVIAQEPSPPALEITPVLASGLLSSDLNASPGAVPLAPVREEAVPAIEAMVIEGQACAQLEPPATEPLAEGPAESEQKAEVPDAPAADVPPLASPEVLAPEAQPDFAEAPRLVPLLGAVDSPAVADAAQTPITPSEGNALAAAVPDDLACIACEGRIPRHARFCLHCGASQTAQAASLAEAPVPASVPAPELATAAVPAPAQPEPEPVTAAPAQVFTSMAAAHLHQAFSFAGAPAPVQTEPAPSAEDLMLERFHKVLLTNANVRKKIDKLMPRRHA